MSQRAQTRERAGSAALAGSPERRRPSARARRRDVEGLRAVAVLAVVAYHAGLPVPGGFVGVDVFFVVSGFLITGNLVAELDATGRLDLPRFYARRIRRLLPMSLLVLVATVALAFALLDPLRAGDTLRDAAFTAAGVANGHLAASGTDYLDASQPPSPLQHYWSLAVEEQFYLCWPLLLLAVAVVARGAGAWGRRAAQVVALGLILVVSLLVSAVTTTSSPIWAYFGTHTRAWELALGGLVALATTRRRSAGRRQGWTAAVVRRASGSKVRRAAAWTSWAGLAGIVASMALLDRTTPFPGVAALAPTLATAAVILGGEARGGAVLLLGRGPLQTLGGWSYGWYLWHWPLLVLLVPHLSAARTTHEMQDDVPVVAGVAVALLSLAVTAATYRLVERPTRTAAWPLRRPGLTGMVAVGISGVLALGMLQAARPEPVRGTGATALPPLVAAEPSGTGPNAAAPHVSDPTSTDPASTEPAATNPAASALDAAVTAALAAGLLIREVPDDVTPALREARRAAPAPQWGCHAGFDVTTVDDAFGASRCVYGDPAGAVTVVLYGDSHALQWFPALERIAKGEHWRLVPLTKSACPPFALDVWLPEYRRVFHECRDWQASALRRLAGLRPALVVMSAKTSVDDHGLHGGGWGFDAAWATGTGTAVAQVRAATSAPVVMIEDTPLPPPSTGMVPSCLAEHPHAADACAFDAAAGAWPQHRREVQRRAATREGAVVVDPEPWFCTGGRCPVLVGRALVYRDTDHVSIPYSRWLAPALAERLPDVTRRP